MNILTNKFNTKYETVPFGEIKEEYYFPAFQELVGNTEVEINTIANNPSDPTFENTIEALAYSGEQLDRVSSLFFNLNSAETNDEIQKIAQEVSPILTEFSSKISQNEVLFQRVKKVFDNKNILKLSEEQETLLHDTYNSFVRNGALLDDEDKRKLEKINIDLSMKSLQFGQNVLSATNHYFKHIIDKEELIGIPEAVLAQYAEEAKERGLEGYVITLHYPSYLPAVTYSENRNLREELFLANGKKAFDSGKWDNQSLIKEIVTLRQEKAKLLGYTNFAEYVLEERMAENSQKVFDFLYQLLEKATPFAEKEITELKTLAKEDGIDEMQNYDHAFYAEKLRKCKFDLNDEELKPYFQLEKVQEAVFDLAKRLFGLKFLEVTDIQKYHSEVKTYEVYDDSNGKREFKAILYTDFHPRKGKRAGAWMTSFKNQWKKNGQNSRPHISVVCNFSKPTADTPSLLTFQEVTTLFHEFGHALHGILADTQ